MSRTFDDRYKRFSWFKYLPDYSKEVSEPHLNLFFSTMFERQEIWYKRHVLEQQSPWTEDKLFKDFKFTNVYREQDRSSQYLINNILLNKSLKRADIIFQTLLYRIFNNPDLFEKIKIPTYSEYDQYSFTDDINYYSEEFGNPFTNAYFINVSYCEGSKRPECYCKVTVPKIYELTKVIIKELPEINKTKNAERLMELFNTLPMVSDFIAHEFYQDFTYIGKYSKFPELCYLTQDDFTNVGPGASLGIRLIFPNCKSFTEQKQKIYVLRDMATEMLSKVGKFKYVEWDREKETYVVRKGKGKLTLHSIEMWLCELQKYWKMQIGEGRQRMKFKPRND